MKTIEGDLLRIERGLIVHQVNCEGACGGLAGALRRRHPQAFAAYFTACVQKQSPIGRAVIGVASPDLFIGHVFGQVQPGANTDLLAVESALVDLKAQLAASLFRGIAIFAPHLMGCGLGGGRWADYLPIIQKHLPSSTIIKLPN